MATKDSAQFYADKGLKRTTMTLHPDTIATLGATAKEFTKQVKITSQGEIVDVMAELYRTNPQFKAMLDAGMMDFLSKKELKKTGRPITTLEGKLRKLSDEERKQLEAALDAKQ